MKYVFTSLVILQIIIFSFNFSNAFASGPLSFDQNAVVMNHAGVISCLGCINTPNPFTVTVTQDSTSKSFTLTRDGLTNNYYSGNIVFKNCSSCTSLEFNTNPTGGLLTVSASGFTPSSISVATSMTFSGSGTPYNQDKKDLLPRDTIVNTCAQYGGDLDGDHICDFWENNSYSGITGCGASGLCIRTSSSVIPYFLSCNPSAPATDFRNVCPSPTKADIYLEIDYMVGHKPTDSVISDVAVAFTASGYNKGCPQCISGITLHAQIDEQLPHVDSLSWPGLKGSPGFNQLKYWWFGTNGERGTGLQYPTEDLNSNWVASQRGQKGQVFHYVIFGHKQLSYPTSSGISERPGNDLLISLGSFDSMVGSLDKQKGTLLHELGHNMGLQHGGGDSNGCKPNYLSVMSYTRQFATYVGNSHLDLSHQVLNSVSEVNPIETVTGSAGGVGPTAAGKIIVFNSTIGGIHPYTVTSSGNVDWNNDGDTFDSSPSQNLNNISIGDCKNSSYNQNFVGFNDWDPNFLSIGPLGTMNVIANCDESQNPPNGSLPNPPDELATSEIINQSNPPNELPLTENIGSSNSTVLELPGDLDQPDSTSDDDFGISNGGSCDDHGNVPVEYPGAELTSEDVTFMYTSRFDSLKYSLDSIKNDDFNGDAADARIIYNQELDEIKSLIKKNTSYDNKLIPAYDKMLEFQKHFDGQGNDELIKTDTIRKQILAETYDIILITSIDLDISPPATTPEQTTTPKQTTTPELWMYLIIGAIIAIIIIIVIIMIIKSRK